MIASEALKIEREIVIHAPRARVWRALTTRQEFGKWFCAKLQGSFEPGKRLDMVSTHRSCSGDPNFFVVVERMEPEHTFSWRWHPGAASEDPTTLVEFHLEEVSDGTLVTVTETGFEGISLARRSRAFEENSHGWEIQLESLARYAGEAA